MITFLLPLAKCSVDFLCLCINKWIFVGAKRFSRCFHLMFSLIEFREWNWVKSVNFCWKNLCFIWTAYIGKWFFFHKLFYAERSVVHKLYDAKRWKVYTIIKPTKQLCFRLLKTDIHSTYFIRALKLAFQRRRKNTKNLISKFSSHFV